jgi:molecular chaperone GrpE
MKADKKNNDNSSNAKTDNHEKDKSKKTTHKDKKQKVDKKKNKKKKEEESVDVVPPVDDRYLRLQADFDNYRKRVLREKDELYRRANEDIMEELLPVLDHLDLALAAAGDKADDPVVEGFRLVGDQLVNALGKFGLKLIETAGKEFDPNLHEAIMHMPTTEVEEDHIVSDARKGYKLGERLLRASQVVVSSGSPEVENEDEE